MAFGEGGLIVNPPTDDDLALYATIDRLEPSSGTSLGTGIQTALNLALSESGPGIRLRSRQTFWKRQVHGAPSRPLSSCS